MTSKVKRNIGATLAVLDGPEWNSSDEEDDAEAEKKIVPKRPKANKPKKTNSIAEVRKEADASNVIYLGHLPSNFEEDELRGFLSQFGDVTHIKLIRARKTANPRGYGFVEFEDPEVAQVVADTMSGYLMGQKRVVCHVLPKEKVHPDLFKGSDRVFKKIDWAGLHRAKVNRPKPAKKMKEITKRLISRDRTRRERLKAMGIEYDFPGYAASNDAFPLLAAPQKEKRAPEAATEEKPEPPSKKSKVERSEVSSKKSKVTKLDTVVTPAKKGKVDLAGSHSKKSTVNNAEPRTGRVAVGKEEPEPPAKKGIVTKGDSKAETPAKKSRIEKLESSTQKGKVSIAAVRAGKDNAEKAEPSKKLRSDSVSSKSSEKVPIAVAKRNKELINNRKGRQSLDAPAATNSEKGSKKKNAKGRKSV
jgi:nucleolar protein 15